MHEFALFRRDEGVVFRVRRGTLPPGVRLFEDGRDAGVLPWAFLTLAVGEMNDEEEEEARVPNAKVILDDVGNDGVIEPSGVGNVGTGEGRGCRGCLGVVAAASPRTVATVPSTNISFIFLEATISNCWGTIEPFVSGSSKLEKILRTRQLAEIAIPSTVRNMASLISPKVSCVNCATSNTTRLQQLRRMDKGT